MPISKKSPKELKNSPGSATPLLQCPHCGIDHNSRGNPFNQASLNLHILKSHAAEMDEEVKPDGALSCEICGCWKSRKGTPFVTDADLSRHRSVAHRGESPASHPEHNGNSAPAKRRVRPHAAAVPVKFCPQCGCNVEVVAAALSFLQ